LAAPMLGDERALVIKRELQSLEIRESLTGFLAALTP
jgi:hypothetical protein